MSRDRMDDGCMPCMGGSHPRMCDGCVDHSNLHTEKEAWDALKLSLTNSIKAHYAKGEDVTDEEKEQNKRDVAYLHDMVDAELLEEHSKVKEDDYININKEILDVYHTIVIARISLLRLTDENDIRECRLLISELEERLAILVCMDTALSETMVNYIVELKAILK